MDYNQRSGIGANDAFVEIGLCNQRSLAGYQIEVHNAAATPVCRHVYEEDNWTGPLKVIWGDEMTDGNGEGWCTMPSSGTVYLLNDVVARSTAAPTVTGTPPTATATATGTPPTPTPTTVPRGTPIATRTFPGATPGLSWAAVDWEAPAGGWTWGTPNPGR